MILRLRAARFGVLFVIVLFVLLLLCAVGVYVVQITQASAACGSVPRPDTCFNTWPPLAAGNAAFAAVAGMLAAIVMAVTVGIAWNRNPSPNTALALRLSNEEESFERERSRRSQLQELNALALAKAVQRANRTMEEEVAAQIAAEQAAQDSAFEQATQWQIEEDTKRDSEEQRRRRALAERLRALARSNPQTVADVLRTWINQTRPGQR